MGNEVSLRRSRGRGGTTLNLCGLGFDLDEVIRGLSRCQVGGEALAAFGRDALGRPDGMRENVDFGSADGLEGGEAVLDLRGQRGVFRRGGEDEGDADAMARRDTGDAGAGGVGVGCDGDGFDEAEIDDVEGDLRLVAVAEGGEDGGLGERELLGLRRHAGWFEDNATQDRRAAALAGWSLIVLAGAKNLNRRRHGCTPPRISNLYNLPNK
jgi:hypothetical protein